MTDMRKKSQGDYVKEAKAKARDAVKQDPTLNEEEVTAGLLVDWICGQSDVRAAFGNPDCNERQRIDEMVRKILKEWRAAKPRRKTGEGMY